MERVKRKNARGITLIALIITIIVMLILVTVSIQIALNTGLFDSAGKATQDWKSEQERERNLVNGNIVDKYVAESTCNHSWEEWEINTEEGKQERICNECEKTESKLIIGATIVGYNPSVAEDGSTINTTYESVGMEGDLTIAGGSTGNGYNNQEFTVTSITDWQVLGEENGQIIITPSTAIRTVDESGYEIRGQAGYMNMIEELNKISSIYGQGKYADTSKYSVKIGEDTIASGGRCIKLEDIGGTIKEGAKTHTYTKNAETGYINDSTVETIFSYWGEDVVPSEGKEWKTLENGQSVTIASLEYNYDEWSQAQENMLNCTDYWFANQTVQFNSEQVMFCGFGRLWRY